MQTSLPWRLIRTLIISFLVTLLLLTGLTFLLYKFRLGESQITVGIYAIYIVSCFLAGVAGRHDGDHLQRRGSAPAGGAVLHRGIRDLHTGDLCGRHLRPGAGGDGEENSHLHPGRVCGGE